MNLAYYLLNYISTSINETFKIFIIALFSLYTPASSCLADSSEISDFDSASSSESDIGYTREEDRFIKI